MATPTTKVVTNISPKNITLVAEKIGPDLIKLAKEFQLDDVEMNKLYQSRKSNKIKTQMMIHWWILRNGTRATNEKLAESLNNISHKQLADELVNKTRVMQPGTSPGPSNTKLDKMDRTDIKVIVDNIGSSIFPLARELELCVTDQEQLKKGSEDLKEKAFLMIQKWKENKRTQATKSSMITALRHIDRNDLADTLSTTNGPQTPIDLTSFKKRMGKKYSIQSVPQPPGIKKDIGIDDIFIDQNMEIIQKEKNQQIHSECNSGEDIDSVQEGIRNQLALPYPFMDDKKQFLHKESLVQQFNKPNNTRILVEGYPGFGKTTLSIKLASDWGKTRQYVTSIFDLVILIPLREVGNETLQDVIVEMINRVNVETPITRKQLDDYLTKTKVLLILDGYDEMSKKGIKHLKPILMKEVMEKTNIIVTSRRGFFTIKDNTEHSSSALLLREQDEYDFWDLRVCLRGISAEQRNEILEKHFQIDSVKLSQIKELFTNNVNEIFQCPLLVFWLGCMLEKDDVEQIHTRTVFYKHLVNLILHKTLVREKLIIEKNKIDIFSTTTDSQLKQDIFKLGNMCLQRLMSQNVLFRQSDLTHLENSVLLKSDLLVSYKSLTRNEEETIYQPMHRSFLEFLAAFSVCYSINGLITFDQFNHTITNLVNEGLSPSEDSLFFPFVVGLMDRNPDWLFRSLSPWSSLNKADQPKMINLFVELNQQVDDNVIQLLLNFIPAYYQIIPSQGIGKSYYSSSFLKRLLENAANKQLISVMDWNIDRSSFTMSSITLQRLFLIPQNIECEFSFLQCSIHCKELIYCINKNMNRSSWKHYLSISQNISADQRNLKLINCNSSTCSLALNETNENWSEIQFHRVMFSNCNLEDQHVDAIIQLVKNDRIQKGVCIYIQLDTNTKLTVTCVNRLWEALIQSKLITEFSFYNFNPDFIPIFQLIPSFYTKSFHLLHFSGFLKVVNKESFGNTNSIQQLTLGNFLDNVNVNDVVSNFSDVHYFEFYSSDNCLFYQIPFLSTVTELYLGLNEQFDVSSLMDVLPSLTKLILSVELISSDQIIKDLILSLFKTKITNDFSKQKKLTMLGFYFIQSLDWFEYLVNCLTKVGTLELQCLQLLFHENCELKSEFNSKYVLQNLLKDKHIEVLSFVDILESIKLCCILPCWFPQEHFKFEYKIVGNDENDFIRSRQHFQHFLNSFNEYHIESKK